MPAVHQRHILTDCRQPRRQGLQPRRAAKDCRPLPQAPNHHLVGRGLRPPVLRPLHPHRDAVARGRADYPDGWVGRQELLCHGLASWCVHSWLFPPPRRVKFTDTHIHRLADGPPTPHPIRHGGAHTHLLLVRVAAARSLRHRYVYTTPPFTPSPPASSPSSSKSMF
jgi:hypothetical protein